MNYEKDELFPLVIRLANTYVDEWGGTITYRTAERFVEAIRYCIRQGGHCKNEQQEKDVEAETLYQIGYESIVKRKQVLNQMYCHMKDDFLDYGYAALRRTMFEEMPRFFRKYDALFSPFETDVRFRYPVLKKDYELKGMDEAEYYLHALGWEQQFFRMFDEDEVKEALREEKSSVPARNLCYLILFNESKKLDMDINEEWDLVLQKVLAKKCQGQEEVYQYLKNEKIKK